MSDALSFALDVKTLISGSLLGGDDLRSCGQITTFLFFIFEN